MTNTLFRFAVVVLGHFWFHIDFWVVFSCPVKDAVGILGGSRLVSFSTVAILAMLILFMTKISFSLSNIHFSF